ncbi:hypothetical protein [Catellatospora chokoriensis]|uniref:Lipoprotein n=1 Tax=Catellatospora chokoriensis TaxID=310353 RepID=A0A8J3JWS1_9ACTN|nr:hypothetical protein [Catellatospora chokoriensis]GIF88531.1 hypothetical protein Cch02nite_19750 [Catellatospora chokoriensis]
MRRVFAAVFLSGALLAVAACGAEAEPQAAASAPAPDYSANTKTVCTALESVLSGETLQKKTDEALATALKDKKTLAEIEKASIEVMQGIFTEWAAGIEAEGAKAEDPQFKADVKGFADALKAEVAKIVKVDDADKVMDAAAVTSAGEKLDKYCA